MRKQIRRILEEEVITTNQFAQIADLNPQQIKEKALKGEIESVLISHTRLYDRADAEEL